MNKLEVHAGREQLSLKSKIKVSTLDNERTTSYNEVVQSFANNQPPHDLAASHVRKYKHTECDLFHLFDFVRASHTIGHRREGGWYFPFSQYPGQLLS